MTAPSAADPLLILAMDHRDSFAKLFGVTEPAPADEAAMRAAKQCISLVHTYSSPGTDAGCITALGPGIASSE